MDTGEFVRRFLTAARREAMCNFVDSTHIFSRSSHSSEAVEPPETSAKESFHKTYRLLKSLNGRLLAPLTF
jgi:hypothetical protein